MNLVLALTIICVQTAIIDAELLEYRDCGSELGTIHTVDITDCPTQPCVLNKNTIRDISVVFTANYDISEATTQVSAFIPVKVPFAMDNTNACLNMPCPILAGTNVTYRNLVFVDPHFPLTNVFVEWQLTSGSDTIICFTVPATISD